MVRFGWGARRSSSGESSSADPSTSSSGSASPAARAVDPVSVTCEGASAFVGEVYYVTDARTGAALTGWPPAPPPRGFRSAARAPDLDGVVRGRDDAEVRAVVARLAERDDGADPLDPDALARSVSRAVARRGLGASAYFASRALAEQWADCVRRPRGLRPDLFLRRRLARPSDIPATPIGVASRPFGDAYADLCVGWGNPVVAARRGVAADHDQKETALLVLGVDKDGERVDTVKGADPNVAGDGHATLLGGLLTGYVGDAAACDASLLVDDPDDLATWLAPEWENVRRSAAKAADADADADAAAVDPAFAPMSWRTVARRLAGRVSDKNKTASGTPSESSNAAFDAFVASYSSDPTAGALLEDRGFRVDTPVFSSPYVHVVMPADEAAPFDGDDALSMKLARTDARGTLTVTTARMYRPWFFRLEDLAEMIRAAMRVEAANAAERNARRREKTKRMLAALTVAVTNTRPNPKLTGWQIPGLRKGGGGSGRGSGSGSRGGGLFGGDDDDDDDGDDDGDGDDGDTPEGMEDESSPADDELMKEYMREMVRDGTAEDALGSWARAASARASGKSNGGDKDGGGEKQRLNVSPAAHAALVGLVTMYYGWSCVSAAIGNAWDRALCATEIGRWALTMDTPLSAAMDVTEVGSFEGLVATAAARAAVGDLARRSVAATRARAERLDACRIEAETDAARRAELDARREDAAKRADAILRAVDETRARARARRDERESSRGKKGEDDGGRDGSYSSRAASDASSDPPDARRRGGLFARIPIVRRIPFVSASTSRRTKITAKRTGAAAETRESPVSFSSSSSSSSSAPVSSQVSSSASVSSSPPRFSTAGSFRDGGSDVDAETEAEVSRLRGEYDAALREWASIRDEMATLDARRRARDERTASELDAQTADGDEVRRFAGAVADALGEAERAKRAVALARHRAENGGEGDDEGDGEGEGEGEGEGGGKENERVFSTSRAAAEEPYGVLAEIPYGAPPMFVGDLRGGVLGDGTQGAAGPNGVKIRGWFGSGTYSFVGVPTPRGTDASGGGVRRA